MPPTKFKKALREAIQSFIQNAMAGQLNIHHEDSDKINVTLDPELQTLWTLSAPSSHADQFALFDAFRNIPNGDRLKSHLIPIYNEHFLLHFKDAVLTAIYQYISDNDLNPNGQSTYQPSPKEAALLQSLDNDSNSKAGDVFRSIETIDADSEIRRVYLQPVFDLYFPFYLDDIHDRYIQLETTIVSLSSRLRATRAQLAAKQQVVEAYQSRYQDLSPVTEILRQLHDDNPEGLNALHQLAEQSPSVPHHHSKDVTIAEQEEYIAYLRAGLMAFSDRYLQETQEALESLRQITAKLDEISNLATATSQPAASGASNDSEASSNTDEQPELVLLALLRNLESNNAFIALSEYLLELIENVVKRYEDTLTMTYRGNTSQTAQAQLTLLRDTFIGKQNKFFTTFIQRQKKFAAQSLADSGESPDIKSQASAGWLFSQHAIDEMSILKGQIALYQEIITNHKPQAIDTALSDALHSEKRKAQALQEAHYLMIRSIVKALREVETPAQQGSSSLAVPNTPANNQIVDLIQRLEASLARQEVAAEAAAAADDELQMPPRHGSLFHRSDSRKGKKAEHTGDTATGILAIRDRDAENARLRAENEMLRQQLKAAKTALTEQAKWRNLDPAAASSSDGGSSATPIVGSGADGPPPAPPTPHTTSIEGPPPAPPVPSAASADGPPPAPPAPPHV